MCSYVCREGDNFRLLFSRFPIGAPGFAQGLNKDVIWTCRSDEEKKVHFDTRQYCHIFWDDVKDLKKKLVARIKATIL